MKIVYIISTIAKKGGAERIITEKANYLTEHWGYDISIVTLFQEENEKNLYPIHKKIRQINLNIPFYTQYSYKYPIRLWKKYVISHLMRKQLTETINGINPDIIIGVSYSHAEKISTIPCRAKKIIECHEPRILFNSISGLDSFQSKLYSKLFYFRTIEKNADLIVTLTNEDAHQWNKAKRIVVIPNFSIMHITQYSTCEAKRIITVGRLSKEKGFERLINIWGTVSKKHPDWALDIFGEGSYRSNLEKLIETNQVKNVTLRGITDNISQEYATSSICVVTSYLEGFSLVILEAMKHGLPCVAFDCPYGPRHIIEDGKCGYLVKDGNSNDFEEKLNRLIDNRQLRMEFSRAAIERSKVFNTDVIMKQWHELFNALISK
jgi:glycosyltransferase involved in cell wall biosynthesis